MSSRSQKLVLWGILLVAGILRCLFIDQRGIIYDDAFTILLSRQSLTSIITGTTADTMPPLFYFLLHYWMKIDSTIWFLRLLSAGFSLGSLFIFYLITRRLAGNSAALWSAGLAAISPLQIYHAQDIRMYAAAQFFVLLFFWFFLRWEQNTKPQWGNWVGAILAGTAALYTHNLAIFALVVPDFYLLIKRRFKDLFQLSAIQLAIGVLFIPWLLHLPGQLQKVQSAFWTPRPGLVEIIQSMVQTTSSLPLEGIWMMAAVFMAVLIFVLVVYAIVRNRHAYSHLIFVILAVLIPPLLLFILSYLMRPVFVTRGFLTSALFFLGLAGCVIASAPRRAVKIGFASLLISSAIIGAIPQYTFNNFPRSPFREAGIDLSIRVKSTDLVLHDNKLSYFPMLVYSHDLPAAFLPDAAGTPNDTLAKKTQDALGIYPLENLETIRGQYQNVYFVVFEKTIEEYRLIGSDHPVIASLNDRMRLVSQHAWNDLWVYQYAEPGK